MPNKEFKIFKYFKILYLKILNSLFGNIKYLKIFKKFFKKFFVWQY